MKALPCTELAQRTAVCPGHASLAWAPGGHGWIPRLGVILSVPPSQCHPCSAILSVPPSQYHPLSATLSVPPFQCHPFSATLSAQPWLSPRLGATLSVPPSQCEPSAEPWLSPGSHTHQTCGCVIIRGQGSVPELAEHLELLRAASRH